MRLFMILEYDKNTSIDIENHAFKWGGGMSYHLRNNGIEKLNLNLLTEINDNRDYLNNYWSIQGNAYLNFDFSWLRGNERFLSYLFPHGAKNIFHNKIFKYQIIPLIGFEYNNNYKIQNYIPKEYNLLNLYKISGTVFLFDDIFNLAAEYQYRINILNNASDPRKYYRFLQFSLNINLLKSVTNIIYLSAGLDYVDGENPLIGLQHQKFTQFCLKFKM
jgi:hypothetical protein